jgi:hypothetical protein
LRSSKWKTFYQWSVLEHYILLLFILISPMAFLPGVMPAVLPSKITTILQKRAIRTIHRSNYNSHTEPWFKSSGILKVKDLYESQVALFMHDYVCKKLPSSFDNTLKHNYEIQEVHQTRQSNLIFIERCNCLCQQTTILHIPCNVEQMESHHHWFYFT